MAEPIVIIDDDRLIRRILEHAFTKKGWAVTTADSAETGLKLIRSQRPKVLVLDIFLPGKWSGLELLRLLKTDRDLKKIMVVMMTAGDAGRYLAPCREAGAEFIIPKPFSPRAFVHQVENLLKQKEDKP
jgi:two-component system alkaline phosphatase synthesis response regulator PhoP